MQIRLHKQATTTPKVRAAIQASDEPARVLAQRHGTTEQTVWWIFGMAITKLSIPRMSVSSARPTSME